MRLVSVGIGYIGLPLACLFAKAGIDTVGITRSPEKARQINRGNPPFEEPGLGDLLKEVLEKKRFRASATLSDEVAEAGAILICVPTPLAEKGNTIDVTAVKAACEQVGKSMQEGQLVVVESTVTPGLTEVLVRTTLERQSGLRAGTQFHLAHCPERAIPGNTLHEMVHNDRIIGGIDKESTELAIQLYRQMVQGRIISTDARTAEVVKLVENASRDVQIAFANELALICERHSVNVFDVISMANCHPRVNILRPSAGVGGHCLPIDSWFLVEGSLDARVIPAARYINDYMPEHTAKLATSAVEQERKLAGSRFAIFGLAYKPDVDDIRESPSEAIVAHLREHALEVVGYDPHVKSCSFVTLTDNAVEASREADCIIIAQNHTLFRRIDWQEIRKAMRTPVIVDCSSFFETPPKGFTYVGLGKTMVVQTGSGPSR
jgi:UDP-N-acetyl-D-mannosaminuronic acid dehydrogenase